MRQLPAIEPLGDPAYHPDQSDERLYGHHDDPYPLIHEMRRKGSVHQVGYRALMGLPDMVMPDRPSFSIFGYEAATQVLLDSANFSNSIYDLNLGLSFGQSISTMDNPVHGKYRRLFQKAFLPQAVLTWDKSIVTPVIDRLITAFEGSGEADLVAQFTRRYPFDVIYGQLGLPEEDIDTFFKLAITQTDFLRVEMAQEAGRKLGQYFANMIEWRRSEPGDDLVSMLVKAEIDGEKLPDDIVISFLRQLINAAGDTTYRATSVLLFALLNNPDQMEAVRADRTLVASAAEEAIRWDGPVLMHARIAVNEVKVDGVHIPAGSPVFVIAGSANRDPAKFDDPDKFDVFRSGKTAHFGFTKGPHLCLGQHLARIEMSRALNSLLDRLPNLRLNPDKPEARLHGCMLRVPKHLHVRFDPARD